MRRLVVLSLVMALVAGCSSGSEPSATPAATATTVQLATVPVATSVPSPDTTVTTGDLSSQDLDLLDSKVRALHPAPFTIHPETEWVAKLAEIRSQLGTASPDEQLVLVASLVGLLDTHTYLGAQAGLHYYGLLFYRFSDGWFVVSASDTALVGTRLVSIGGRDVADVEATLRTLVPHDNDSGFSDNEDVFSKVEYLSGSGIVADPAQPQYVLERPDGTRLTVDPPVFEEDAWVSELGVVGDLVGAAPEAVARRGEQTWSRLDGANRVLLIAVNDYGSMNEAVEALAAALDAGTADRLVLDLRYLRGGDGNFPLRVVIENEPRINRDGGLTVLIGRENVSAGTVTVGHFDANPAAVLVGEPTPARPDNFLCTCQDVVLPNLGLFVSVPTETFATGDPRDAIEPDIVMLLSSADFFAGLDPVLDAALQSEFPQ